MSDDRKPVLAQLGGFYGSERFAVTFTAGITGEDAKRVTQRGWDKTQPLAGPDYGAALVSGRGLTRNVAIVLRPSNLVVLECDTESDLARIQELNLPITLTVRSSKPYKRHFYFRPPPTLEALPYVAFRFESGKLTADSGRYFLAPPSIHPTGTVYSFLPGLGPDDVDIAELPEQTYRDLSQQAQKETSEQRDQIAIDPDAKIRAGNRRDLIFRYACMLRRWGLTRQEISAQCHTFNATRCEPPVEHSLVEIQVDGAMKKQGDQELAVTYNPEDEPGITPDPHSWTPIDLVATAADPPEPPTISNLVYPGRRHLFSGEPESLKSWAAMVLCVEQIRQGHTTVYIDFEMGGRETLSRLRDLGLTDEELQTSFLYLEPDEKFEDPEILRDTDELLRGRNPTLVIIDAFTGALQVHQLDPNKSVDIEQFYRRVIDPLRRHGAAVVVLDHLPKDPLNRGKFAIGSERKVGAAEVHLGFEAVTPFGRGRVGKAKVTTHKDRPGHLNRPRAAELELYSDPTTHHVTWKLTHPDPLEPGEPFRPTHLMEKVSRWVEQQADPTSRTQTETAVGGKGEFLRKAMNQLVAEGYLQETSGARNARLITTLKAYRENTDPLLQDDPVPPRPHPVRDGDKDDPVPQSPPIGGTGSVGTGSNTQKQDDPVPTTQDGLTDHYNEAEQLVRNELWRHDSDTILETLVTRWPMIPLGRLDELRALARRIATEDEEPGITTAS